MTERQLQRDVAAYLSAVLPPGQVLWYHPMNEGKRGRVGQADFKLGGGLAGLADFVLIWPAAVPNAHRVGFIELKAEKGRLSEAQRAFMARVMVLGHAYQVCRDLDAIAQALALWSVPTRGHKIFASGAVRVAG